MFKINKNLRVPFKTREMGDRLIFNNPIKMEHFDKDGNLLGTYYTKNDIVNQGKDLILNVMFNSATQISTSSWYIGLISSVSYTTLAATDVMNSHAGWTEFTNYTETTRVAWGSATSTSQSTTNATAAQFDINATGTVMGVFITTDNTKGGTAGLLWATALFPASVPVNNGDQIKVSYTVSC